MDLRKIFGIIWKWWWLLVLSTVISGASSYLASKATIPMYRTTTTLMIGRFTQDPNPSSGDIYTSQQLAETYIQLVKRQPVLQGALDELGLSMPWQDLANRVNARTVPRTQLMEITVLDNDPYRAKVLADAIAQQLVLLSPANPSNLDQETLAFTQQQLQDLQNKIQKAQEEIKQLRAELDSAFSARQIQDLQQQINLWETKITDWQNIFSQLLITIQGGDVNTLSIIEEASIPSTPFSPNIPNNVLISSALGLALAICGVLLMELIDDTVKTPEDIEGLVPYSVLGAIERIKGEDYPEKLIALKDPLSSIVESYRVLRTNLQFTSIDRPPHAIMVTSPGPSEGKSLTIANLAVVLAQSGLDVIVADTDLRKPVQHRIFNLPNNHGITDLIRDSDLSLESVLQRTDVDNLKVLTSGTIPPNPADILNSQRMKNLINGLIKQADIVLFDSPPSLLVADSAILSSYVDGTILVIDVGRTRRSEIKKQIEEFVKVRAVILGIVLNRLGEKAGKYYYYYYYYSSDGSKKRRRRKRNGIERALERIGGMIRQRGLKE